MRSRKLWQGADRPVRLTFHRTECREMDCDRIDQFRRVITHNRDPHLLGEVLLRGLKEGA